MRADFDPDPEGRVNSFLVPCLRDQLCNVERKYLRMFLAAIPMPTWMDFLLLLDYIQVGCKIATEWTSTLSRTCPLKSDCSKLLSGCFYHALPESAVVVLVQKNVCVRGGVYI